MRSFRNAPLLLGSILVAVVAASAQVQPVSDPLCGTTVVQDLVLDRDVTCYNAHGLTIGAEGVTIDLNGKSIQCRNGFSSTCHGSSFVGVDASRVTRIVIKGPGTIVGFGVQLVTATNVLQNTRLRPVRAGSSRTVRPRETKKTTASPADSDSSDSTSSEKSKSTSSGDGS
jgi:hypothetical protein